MKYGDRIIEMRGIIVEVQDGAVAMDLKGRLGYLKVPMRMLVTDYPLEVGQEVAFNMSFPEVLSPEIQEKYVKNINRKKETV
ncbi:MAG: CBO2463/CBO2479 domain-containing protein [Fusobacteriaceae bacterium]